KREEGKGGEDDILTSERCSSLVPLGDGGTARIPGPAGRVTNECLHTEDWRNQEMLQVMDWQMQRALDAPIPSSDETEKPQKKGALPGTLRVVSLYRLAETGEVDVHAHRPWRDAPPGAFARAGTLSWTHSWAQSGTWTIPRFRPQYDGAKSWAS
ncbi:hypothetical protein Celaphus_00018343, partial [Cervus elaphus hippelaphus]